MSARRLLLTLLALACALLFPSSAISAATGTNWFEFRNGQQKAVFGPNAEIALATGTLKSQNDCDVRPHNDEEGVNDFFSRVSDVYLVAAGSVDGQGDELVDAVPGEGMFGSGGQNTIIAVGEAFIEETIAFTKPGGKLPPGHYDVVFDTCQDGIFDEGDDTLFADAVRVRFPADVHGNPASPARIEAMKSKAQDMATKLYASYRATQALFMAIDAVEKLRACATGNVYTCILHNLNKGLMGQKGLNAMGITTLKDAAVNLMANVAKHEQAIANDPPDPDFRKLASVAAPAPRPATTDSVVDEAAGPLVDAMRVEAPVAEALLHAIERYQGAQRAADAGWALIHAREVRDLARALAALKPRTREALVAARTLAERPDAQDASLAVLDGVRDVADGLSADQRKELRNLGASDADIAELQDYVRTELADGHGPRVDFSPRQALAAAVDAYDGAATTYADLGASAAAIVADLEGQAAEGRFEQAAPTAHAGGPYEVIAGQALALDASASERAAAWAWDLDGYGAFDDADGERPTVTLHVPGPRVIAVQVTDGAGRRAVSHTIVEVAPASRDTIAGATPADRVVDATTGTTTSFSVDAPAPVRWLVDGDERGTGASFDHAWTTGDVGVHVVEAVAGDVRRRWSLHVRRPDADDDGWHANVDCDDADKAVHPVRNEVFGNDKDDDCDAGTADVPPGGVPGRLLGWGFNRFGQVGDGTDVSRPHPVPIPGMEDVTGIATGSVDFSVAVKADGSVWSWGFDGNDQLGNGSEGSRWRPGRVAAVGAASPSVGHMLGGREVAASQGMNGFALRQDGTIASWGGAGGKGDGTSTQSGVPGLVLKPDGSGPLTGVERLFEAHVGALATVDGGRVLWWGSGSGWQAHACESAGGDGRLPKFIDSVGSDVVDISGDAWGVFLKADGEVLTCNGESREINGRPPVTPTSAAGRVTGLGPGSGVVDIAAGRWHTLALKQDGSVWTWGWDSYGQLGDGPRSSIFGEPRRVDLPEGPKAVKVFAGGVSSFVVRADGSVLAWGSGPLGIESGAGRADSPTPVKLPDGVAVREIATDAHMLAIVGDAPDEPPAPSISVSVADVSVSEAAGAASVELTQSDTSRADTTVTVRTSDGSAKAGSDYSAVDRVVTIPAGSRTATVEVPIDGDPTDEDAETFGVALSSPSANIGLDDAAATVTIADDDDPPAVSVGDAEDAVEGDEGGRPALTYTLTLERASSKPVTIRFATAAGTASPDRDFGSRRGEVTFAPGATSREVTVDVLGDYEVEDDETVRLVAGDSSGTGTIVDQDPYTLTVGGGRVVEGDEGTRELRFTVQRAPAGEELTVRAATLAGSAEPGKDFTPVDETVTIPAGSATATVAVPVLGDTAFEPDERFGLKLSDASVPGERRAIRVERSTEVGVIENDDAKPAPDDPKPGPQGSGDRPADGGTPPGPRSDVAPTATARSLQQPLRPCASRRRFAIRLRRPKGDRLVSATVRVHGKPAKVLRGRRVRAIVNLRGLPRGTFEVTATAKTAKGRTLRETRTYRTCVPKRRG